MSFTRRVYTIHFVFILFINKQNSGDFNTNFSVVNILFPRRIQTKTEKFWEKVLGKYSVEERTDNFHIFVQDVH